MKNIGDKVWTARLQHKEFTEVCPDCLGDKTVTLLLKNGDKHSLECHTCNPGGYQPSRGYVTKTQYQATAKESVINEMEIRADGIKYRFYDWSCNNVFETEAEAVAAAEKIRLEKEAEDFHRFTWKKEDSRRTWAWNCSYYRRQIKDAKRDLAYAEARLGIAQKLGKMVPAPDTEVAK